MPYNIFSKWYKDTRKKIVEVSVDGRPSDRNYPKDNHIAKRTIRKLTTQRNNMLHFGSDEGVEMATAYHSVISTVKLHGMSSWRFLGEFFQKVFSGCRDFLSMTPLNIGLAYSKC